nr:uncharacterized protein LOC119185151 [Rhipicephalus microplus]
MPCHTPAVGTIPIGGPYPVVGCVMSRSVLGQPIFKRQRGPFGEASLLLGHLIDSASRLKPHIFHWRSFSTVAHIPFIYLCKTYGPQSEGFNRGVYHGVQQQQCGCREKRRQRFRRCGRRGKRHRGSHRQARDATAKTQAQAAGISLPGSAECASESSAAARAVRRHLVTQHGSAGRSRAPCGGRHFSLKGTSWPTI